jgi:hypothetical protein
MPAGPFSLLLISKLNICQQDPFRVLVSISCLPFAELSNTSTPLLLNNVQLTRSYYSVGLIVCLDHTPGRALELCTCTSTRRLVVAMLV